MVPGVYVVSWACRAIWISVYLGPLQIVRWLPMYWAKWNLKCVLFGHLCFKKFSRSS